MIVKPKKLIATILFTAMIAGIALAGIASAAEITTDTELPESLITDISTPAYRFWPGGRYDSLTIGSDGQKAVVEEEFMETAASGLHTLEAEGGSVDQMLTLTRLGNKYGISVEFKGLMGAGNPAVGIDSIALETESLKNGTVFDGQVALSSGQDLILEAAIAVQYEEMNGKKVQTDFIKLDPEQFTLTAEGYETEDGDSSGDEGDSSEDAGDSSGDDGDSSEDAGDSSGDDGDSSEDTGDSSGDDGDSSSEGDSSGFGGNYTEYPLRAVYNGDDLELGSNWEVILFYTCYDDDQGGISRIDYYSRNSAQSMINAFAGKFGMVYNEATGSYEPQNEAAQELYEELLINIRDFGSTVLVFDGGDANMMLTDDTWSYELIDKIEELFGYDFTEYLAIMYRDDYTSGSDLFDQQITNEWQTALSYLAADCFGAIDNWAKEIWGADTGFRACVGVSSSLDTSIVTQGVTVPDSETFWPTNAQAIKNFDISTAYNQITSGSHLLRKQVTSHDELGAVPNDHSEKYTEFLLEHANKAFYGGVSYMIYHVTPSKTGSKFGGASYRDWSYTSPESAQGEKFNSYLARIQYIMQNGTAQRDIAIYQNVYDYTCEDFFTYEQDTSIEEAGYSYDFLTPAYMNIETCYAENGVIDPTGGRYRALVINEPYSVTTTETLTGGGMFGGTRNYAPFRKVGKYIPIETAYQFLEFAKNGIPIIVVGSYEDFYAEYTTRDEDGNLIDESSKLHQIFEEIDALGMLYTAVNEEDIVTALTEAGVEPDINKDEPSRIVGWKQHFSTTETGVEGTAENIDADFYYLFNYQKFGSTAKDNENGFGDYMSGETVSQIIYLKGDGIPYQIDLWSGDIIRVADYQKTEDGYIAIPVTLSAYDTAMYMIVGNEDDTLHADDLDADGYFYTINGDDIYLCTGNSGTYTAILSDGSSTEITVDETAEPIDLTFADWTLTVESWSSGYGYTGTRNSTDDKILKEKLESKTVTDLTTQTWNQLGEFTKEGTGEIVDGRTVSGVGYYKTTFTIEGKYDGAILSLGDVFDTAAVYVNGIECYVDMNKLTVDISEALVEGENELTVEIGTNLMNAWYYATAGLEIKDGFGDVLNGYDVEQAYGLYGPVTITPYVSVPVTMSQQ